MRAFSSSEFHAFVLLCHEKWVVTSSIDLMIRIDKRIMTLTFCCFPSKWYKKAHNFKSDSMSANNWMNPKKRWRAFEAIWNWKGCISIKIPWINFIENMRTHLIQKTGSIFYGKTWKVLPVNDPVVDIENLSFANLMTTGTNKWQKPSDLWVDWIGSYMWYWVVVSQRNVASQTFQKHWDFRNKSYIQIHFHFWLFFSSNIRAKNVKRSTQN